MLCMEHAQHLVFLNDQKRGGCSGCSRAHPNHLARHAALSKKVTRAKHRDHRFLAGPIHNGKFHAALLDVHDAISSIALREDRFSETPSFLFLLALLINQGY